MRIIDLELLAFGPFSGAKLDFSRDGVLHLIFGPNEAGKSTALRAITNLLYGIPVNTPDAHRHAMRDLRIGARLSGRDGSVLQVMRRKGSKNTLLSPDETPLADDAFAAWLSGVNESVFGSMFGLDYVSLRDGAHALLEGHGNVGESLFAAGFGGRGVHAVLEELESEASDIFKPRGQNPKLNEAIRLFKDADKHSRETATSAEAYRTQQDALSAARAENDGLGERRRTLAAEQNRLERIRRVLPLLARRNDWSARRRTLGEVAALPEDARARRVAALAVVRDRERDEARLIGEIEVAERRLGERQPSAALLAIDERIIKQLQDRLGSHRKAEEDFPRLKTELRRLEQEALAIPLRLGRHVPLDEIETLRVPVAQQARIRQLAQQRSGVETALKESQRALADHRARQERPRTQLASLAAASDVGPLQSALQRARRLGDIDTLVEAAAKECSRLDQELQRKLATLGLADVSPAGLRELPFPAADSVERFATRFDTIERADDDARKRQADGRRRVLRAQRGLDELCLAGDVPSEDQLTGERRQRDLAWQEIRRRWESGEPADGGRAESYEGNVRATDHLADRLRREAERVTVRARLTAELTECEHELKAVDEDIETLAARRADLEQEWIGLWAPTALSPRAPADMRAWLVRLALVQQLADDVAAKRAALGALEDKRDRARTELAAALTRLGEPRADGALSFERLLDHSAEVAEAHLARARRRTELTRALEDGEREHIDLEQRCAEAQQAAASWKDAWATCVRPLDLPADADAAEALAVLEQLTDLFARMDSIGEYQRRVDGIERDANELTAHVASLIEAHAGELRGLPVTDAAERLVGAYQGAQTDRREQETIAEALSAKRTELGECQQALTQARLDLEQLRELARVASVDDLEDAERGAAEAVELEQELRRIDEELYQAGEGATIDELVDQAHGQDADAVSLRLQDVQTEMEEVQDERAQLLQKIGSLEEGLRHWEAGDLAADAAIEAHEHLAAIKNGVNRYVRLRLAALLLRREIERYRERAQGPLLLRANALFPRLTLDRYTGLRVGFDAGDEPVLRCVRHDGTEVGVDGLSEGTRDQLYLALRIATLQHHGESNEPIPVILDDVLIHFDDARAAAALEVLAELARGTQVLFFTHHRHLIDLARTTLPADRRAEHEL